MRLEKACCCLSLRTGNLILGWLQVIGGILCIIGIAVLIGVLSHTEVKNPDEEAKVKALLAALYIVLVAVCLSPLFGACHLYGSYQFRPGFLLPYLIIGGIQLFLFVVGFIYAIASARISAEHIVSNLVSFAIATYLYLIVWSFYHKLREGTYPLDQKA